MLVFHIIGLGPSLLAIICWGSNIGGNVEFVVPFQQYLLKQSTQAAGTVVPVRSKLRANTAQPTQTGHFLSTVPFPMVATLYPLRINWSR
jgi:hypothetical protein